MRHLIAATFVLCAFSGCATKQQYINPAISDENRAIRQLAIDEGECTNAAVGGAPIPQIQTSKSGGGSVDGTISDGINTYRYTGTTTSSSSFSNAFANGMNLRSASDAKRSQETIRHGCMLSKGWVSGTSK